MSYIDNIPFSKFLKSRELHSKILHLEIIVGRTDLLFSQIKIKIPSKGGSSNNFSKALEAEILNSFILSMITIRYLDIVLDKEKK